MRSGREQPIRVLVVDDHAVVRQGIAALLADAWDLEVVATASDGRQALARCEQLDVDVVLMDLAMPDMDGATATARILERRPDVRVVALTAFADEAVVRRAVDAGISACLLKTVTAAELADAVRGVVHGQSTFSSAVLSRLLQRRAELVLGEDLTARERDVLGLLVDGRTNRDIADELGLSPGTVRVYVSSVLAKLGVANRTEASVVAVRHRLVDDLP